LSTIIGHRKGVGPYKVCLIFNSLSLIDINEKKLRLYFNASSVDKSTSRGGGVVVFMIKVRKYFGRNKTTADHPISPSPHVCANVARRPRQRGVAGLFVLGALS